MISSSHKKESKETPRLLIAREDSLIQREHDNTHTNILEQELKINVHIRSIQSEYERLNLSEKCVALAINFCYDQT